MFDEYLNMFFSGAEPPRAALALSPVLGSHTADGNGWKNCSFV